ncbi:permease-like cell division protein FtsX [Arthrobacter glacialis]|uniref:Cell division protein FtsX n=1 Tax=Arthrobacter glacialis TaxID=1664 RepID=A0A2S3ZZ66_ARTGL|nr:permease-like cell division protein FtsX [Arthrobacter glacialis]POH59944.1 cell division protein FtsX [Arthrobacter glacialis]POH74575.1 cell division protein FtsX [Arthrobacter glacialis]
MRLAFIMSELGSGLRRNLTMVISVILVTFVSLTFVGAAGLLQMQIGQLKGFWYDKVQVTIYLCTDIPANSNCVSGPVTPDQKATIEGMLESPAVKPYIENWTFETQEEALAHFREQFANSPMVDSVEAGNLPSSFRIKLDDPEKYQIINETFSATPGVDSVVDQRKVLEKLFSWMNIATYVAMGVAGLMIICAALLIATTIRLSAQSRMREIDIMRLVGASKTVIQLPFVLEGVIAATIGALLASGAVWSIVVFFMGGYLADANTGTPFISAREALVIYPVLILLGVVLAGVASAVSLRKNLKV